jgi:hypothetical protein
MQCMTGASACGTGGAELERLEQAERRQAWDGAHPGCVVNAPSINTTLRSPGAAATQAVGAP